MSSESRIQALDLARGLAVLFMVTVHVKQEWTSTAVQESPWGWFVETLGSQPAAPVFMTLMGASLAFSRSTSALALARRGLLLMLGGYLLNGVRGAFPAWVGLRLGAVTPADMAPWTPWTLLWIVDILPFAGLSLVLLAPLRRWGRPWLWVSLAVAVSALAPSLWGRTLGVPVLDLLTPNLWGTGEAVSFPLFPWFAFPLVGLAWGTGFRTAPEAGPVFQRTLLGGLTLLGAGLAWIWVDLAGQVGDTWRAGPGGVAWTLGFVACWTWLCWCITERVRESRFLRLMSYWSRHVTVFYVMQWLVVGWGTGAVGYRALGWPGACLGWVGAPLLAHAMTWVWVEKVGPWMRRA